MAGYVDHAYRMLLQIKPPSWLYAVQMGATTVWERWDSMLPDGSINTGSMTSFNHYAYGAVADWIHRTIVGLEPLQAGYRQFSVCPRLGGGLYNASLRSRCPYGIIEVSWTTEADLVVLEVTVPFGATAQVWAPGDVKSTFAGWGKHRFERTLSKVTDKEAFDVAPRPRH